MSIPMVLTINLAGIAFSGAPAGPGGPSAAHHPVLTLAPVTFDETELRRWHMVEVAMAHYCMLVPAKQSAQHCHQKLY